MLAEKKSSLGMLTLPLNRLLNASDLTLDQHFQLERSGSNAQLKMKAILRVILFVCCSPGIALHF